VSTKPGQLHRARAARSGQYALVDEAELRRRIEVYLEADLPNFSEPARVADALAPRLFQYIRQPAEEAPTASTTLDALLPADALVFFGASWDGYTQRYRPTVHQAAERLGRRVVEVDVDDPVGSAIAAVFSVVSTPAVALVGTGSPIIGERALDDLVASLGATT
jgi:thiol-disulfide isomerase/thioredoxin